MLFLSYSNLIMGLEIKEGLATSKVSTTSSFTNFSSIDIQKISLSEVSDTHISIPYFRLEGLEGFGQKIQSYYDTQTRSPFNKLTEWLSEYQCKVSPLRSQLEEKLNKVSVLSKELSSKLKEANHMQQMLHSERHKTSLPLPIDVSEGLTNSPSLTAIKFEPWQSKFLDTNFEDFFFCIEPKLFEENLYASESNCYDDIDSEIWEKIIIEKFDLLCEQLALDVERYVNRIYRNIRYVFLNKFHKQKFSYSDRKDIVDRYWYYDLKKSRKREGSSAQLEQLLSPIFLKKINNDFFKPNTSYTKAA